MNSFKRIWLSLGFCLMALSSGAVDLQLKQSVSAPNGNERQVDLQLLIHAPHGIAAGQTFFLGARLNHKPGWHTYWINPGDSGLPTTLKWQLPTGMTPGQIHWPLPKKLTVADLTNYGFEDEALLVVPVKVDSRFQPSSDFPIQLDANWLACENACIPEEAQIQTRITTQPQRTHQNAFEAIWAQQPKRLQTPLSATWSGDRLPMAISGLPPHWEGHSVEAYPMVKEVLASAMERNGSAGWSAAAWTLTSSVHEMNAGPVSNLPIVLVSRVKGVTEAVEVNMSLKGDWPAARPASKLPAQTAAPTSPQVGEFDALQLLLACAGALLGGLLLNLMPCVLPVLSIKAMSLASPQLTQRQRQRQSLGFALGTVGVMSLIGLTLVALRSAGAQLGWGFQLQSPWMVMALITLFTLMALNLWGLFEWPSFSFSTSSRPVHQDGFWQATATGALTVIVASPCTAPFMGASLGLALTLPMALALPIFICLGLGLALPLALLAHVPALSLYLPQPGAWMIRFRQGLGFPMMATALWLFWVLGQQTHANATGLLSLMLLTLAAALATTRLQSAKWRWGWRVFLVVALVACLPWLNQQVQTAPVATAQTSTASPWQPWSVEAVEQATRAGQPVFIDFTAAWCITCQFNEKTVLSREDVQQAFRDHGVVTFKADWTRQDPRITQALKALGRSGVPVYVLIAPQQEPRVFPELLNPKELLQALQQLP